jgi:hypothetical protein
MRRITGLSFPSSSSWTIWLAVCAALMADLTVGQHAHAMQLASGAYTGNGAASRPLTGVGFRPDAVIIKGNTAQYAVLRTGTMTGDATKELAAGAALQSKRIQSLDADGFTVGNHAEVNKSGVVYSWVAFSDDGARDFRVGSYVGSGSDNRSVSGLGFQPVYVIVMSSGAQPAVQRSLLMTGDTSFQFDNTGAKPNNIQALQTDGFQVGSDARVNAARTTYHYAAWKAVGGRVSFGAYDGTGADNRSITGAGFQPDYVIIKAGANEGGVHRTAMPSGDSTLLFSASSNATNAIQALASDGFQVGNGSSVNASRTTRYFWMAFRAAPAVDPATALTITSINGGTRPTAGTGFSVIVQSRDGAGGSRSVTSATAIRLSLKTGSGTLAGTLTGTIPAGASQATISGVTYTKAEGGVVLTATRASGDALTPGDSAPFAVDPGAIAGYTVSLASPEAAGTVFGVNVTAQDQHANRVTTDSSTLVTLSSASGHVLFDSNLDGGFGDPAKALTAGALSLNAKGTVAETTTVAATDTNGRTGFTALTVTAGLASRLAFTIQPGPTPAGVPIPGPPTVAVQDSFGNAVTSSSVPITVAIGANPGGGTLAGATTRNAISGTATFDDLTISQPGSGYALTAASAGLTGATSAAFTVTATSGTISGRVTRASDGASLAGIAVDALQSGLVKGSATTGADGTYSLARLVPGAYDVRASAQAFQAQTQAGITVSAGSIASANFSLTAIPELAIRITAPATGSVLHEPSTLVQGEVSGADATGVTLTMPTSIQGQLIDLPLPVEVNNGRFAGLVGLAPGTVQLIARATDPSGQSAQDSIIVSFQPDPPDYDQAVPPDVSPTVGFAPLTVTFGGTEAADPAVTGLDLDVDGDGQPDFTLVNFATPPYQVTYTYRTEGLYTATMVVRDQTGQSRTTRVPINVLAVPDLLPIWDAFRNALGRGDVDTAAGFVALEARERYRRVFDDLRADLPSIAAALGAITPDIVSPDYATASLTRVRDGVSEGFLIHFLRDGDGVWRIVSM